MDSVIVYIDSLALFFNFSKYGYYHGTDQLAKSKTGNHIIIFVNFCVFVRYITVNLNK
jgi:hypothetical protein